LRTILGLILIGVFAYLGTAMFRRWRLPVWFRAFAPSGLSFFGIGILLGPHVTGFINDVALNELDVVVNLGVGWVGLLFGLQFSFWDIGRLSKRTLAGAATESFLTLLIVGTGIWAAAQATAFSMPGWLVVVVLVIIACPTSPTIGAQVNLDLRARGPVTHALRVIVGVDALPAIVLLGVFVCFSPLHPPGEGLLTSGWLWLIATGVLGLALGILFHFFTLYQYDDNQLRVVVLGLVVFCGGVAHFLLLSPLFVNLIVGVVVANRSPRRTDVLGSLLRLEKPIYLILLTLAGAMWRLPPLSLLALVPLFILLRFIGKLIGGALAGRVIAPSVGMWGVGPGLLPHGGMALALALNIKQFFPGPLGDLAINAAIGSMVIATLVGPWAIRRLLIAEGEAS
jgi:hypothetical protein